MTIEIKEFNPKEQLWRINNLPRKEDGTPDFEKKEQYKKIPCKKLFAENDSADEFGNSLYFGCENPHPPLTPINTECSVFNYLDVCGYLIEITFCQPCNYIFYDDIPPKPGSSEWYKFIDEIEKHIDKKYTSPFIMWLGKHRYAFKCLDYKPEPKSLDSKRYEIIIPHIMLKPRIFNDRDLGLWERDRMNNIHQKIE